MLKQCRIATVATVALYVAHSAPKCAQADLLVHYDFDNVTGSTVTNLGTSGATNNGTKSADLVVVSDPAFGNVGQFTNNGPAYPRLSINSGIAGGKLTTIAAWYKGTDFQNMFDQDNGGPVTARNVIANSGSTVQVFDGAFENTGFLTSGIADGEWHHWAVTVNGNTGAGQLYVDGVAVGSAVSNLTAWELIAGGPRNYWGDSTTNGDFLSEGLHHDIRIYNEILGAEAIAALAAFPANPAPEPSALLLATLGLVGLLGGRRWRRR